MAKLACAVLLFGVGCGGAETPGGGAPIAAGGPASASPSGGDVSVDGDEDEDGQRRRCASDDDCVVGGPARCCTSSGPSCAEAWSRAAWDDFRSACAARACERDVMMVCPDAEDPPPTHVACVDARCVLR